MTGSPGWRRLAPLVVGTAASQSLLVVLSPTVVAIGEELGAPVAAVGQARTVTAGVAVAASVALASRAGRLGVRRLLGTGGLLAVAASGLVAAAPTVAVFLLLHTVVGLAFALLLSGGFAGLAGFTGDRRAWATGWVTSANALAWIVVNPLAGGLAGALSWRAAQAAPGALGLAAALTAPLAADVLEGPTTVGAPLRDGSARRWLLAEVAGFAGWTALLTFAGAFFVEQFGLGEAVTGWVLAAGAGAYVLAATRARWLAGLASKRRLAVTAALVMAVLVPALLTRERSAVAAGALFCLAGLAAGVRTPASSRLALELLPGHTGAMMTARTAATQAGYLVGAAAGGAVIAAWGYAALGVVLAGLLALSAVLVSRVSEPAT